MQMLYNSDSFVVVQFDLAPADASADAPAVASGAVNVADAAVPQPDAIGGYEIVDKLARKEIFIQGAVAVAFKLGVQALAEQGPATEDTIDDYLAGYTALAQQPLVLH